MCIIFLNATKMCVFSRWACICMFYMHACMYVYTWIKTQCKCLCGCTCVCRLTCKYVSASVCVTLSRLFLVTQEVFLSVWQNTTQFYSLTSLWYWAEMPFVCPQAFLQRGPWQSHCTLQEKKTFLDCSHTLIINSNRSGGQDESWGPGDGDGVFEWWKGHGMLR